MVTTVTTAMINFSGGCVIFFAERLRNFLVERLRDFFVRRGFMIFCVKRLRNFFCVRRFFSKFIFLKVA